MLKLSKTPAGQFFVLDISVSDRGVTPGKKSVNVRVVLLNERSSNGTGSGSVYVGTNYGSNSVSFTSGQVATLPVFANVGFQDLEGIDVTIR